VTAILPGNHRKTSPFTHKSNGEPPTGQITPDPLPVKARTGRQINKLVPNAKPSGDAGPPISRGTARKAWAQAKGKSASSKSRFKSAYSAYRKNNSGVFHT
jgi:hypothetical protein